MRELASPGPPGRPPGDGPVDRCGDGDGPEGSERPKEEAMRAYILIETTVGRADDVAREATRIEGVTLANTVSGPFDVVIRTETSGFVEFSNRILPVIQEIGGITRTVTCIVKDGADLVERTAGPAAAS
jgi:hypothetical protein